MYQAGITEVDPGVAGPFRYRMLDGRYLITNDFGDWTFLSPEELKAFSQGEISPGDALYERLKDLRFIHGEIDLDQAVRRYRNLHSFLHHGPSQHVLALTSRASADDEGPDMSVELADRAVDCAFMSTSPRLTFVLGGGDPLMVSDLVRHVVEYVEDKNRLARKEVRFVLQTAMTALDDEMASWLEAHPMDLWIPYGSADLAASGSTRESLTRLQTAWEGNADRPNITLQADLSEIGDSSPADLVTLAVDAGFDVMDLAPVPTWDFMLDGAEPGMSSGDWIARWEEAVDQMIQQEANGRAMMERTAGEVLSGVLDGNPPPVPTLCTPALDGIGQLAYHWCGRVFASELGREVYVETEDELFQVGELRHHGYHDMITGATVRSLLMASVLDGQPGWSQWVYKPWGGLWPAANYVDQGSIHGRMGDSPVAQKLTGIMDALFRRLGQEDPTTQSVFQRWGDVTST